MEILEQRLALLVRKPNKGIVFERQIIENLKEVNKERYGNGIDFLSVVRFC